MVNSTSAMIIVGVLVVILLCIVGYYLARFLKGKLTLTLSSRTVDSKQPVAGSLTVHAKKNINGLLIVALVGRMRQKKRRTNNNSNTTSHSEEWVEVFRRETVLEEQRDFPPGFIQPYQFTFVAPTSSEARSGEGILRQMANQVGGALGTVLNLSAGAVGMMQQRISWHVEARLDADGVDLYAKCGLTINLRD